jgi:hypothetical protein
VEAVRSTFTTADMNRFRFLCVPSVECKVYGACVGRPLLAAESDK